MLLMFSLSSMHSAAKCLDEQLYRNPLRHGVRCRFSIVNTFQGSVLLAGLFEPEPRFYSV